jgi:YHS domain-containing protein
MSFAVREDPMKKPNLRESMVLAALASLVLVLANHPVVRAQQSPKPAVFTEFRSKLALDGYDAVAYFKGGKPVKGSREHTTTWNGGTWHFASAENQAAFEAAPQRFAPQYGGYCAWAVSEGYTAKGDPSYWRIVDGKLYLNYNASVQKDWEKKIPVHIAKGDKNWPSVLSK